MNARMDFHAQHAVYAPSSAHRWVMCTASATAIAAMERVIPQEDSEASTDGTRAHDEVERILKPLNNDGIVGGTEFAALVNDIDASHPAAFGIALFVNFASRLAALYPGRFWIEQRVRLTDQIWGRLDLGHWHAESKTVTIVDLKNGYVGVDAEENDQFRIYAAALIQQYDLPAEWIRYVCVQPNDFQPVSRVKQWIEPVRSLMAWAAKTVKIPNGPLTFKYGSHCRDCPLLGACDPTKDVLAQFATVVATGTDPAPAQIPLFLALKKPIDHFFEGLIKNGTKKVLAGAVVPGMGLFTGDKRRAWKSVSIARAAVVAQKGVDALSPPTPAQAEAMGINIEGLADKPEGGPVLAFDNDKRKPWVPRTSGDMFAGIPGLGVSK